MPFQRPSRVLSILASVLPAAGIALAVAGCSHITPLGPDRAPVSLPPPRDLGSPISLQVMRSQPPTPAGRCPADSVDLFGLALVPRAAPAGSRPVRVRHMGPGSATSPTATPAATPTLPVGVACYRPVGRPVTVTSAAVSSVATYPPPPDAPNGPATYGFVVGFPVADVAAVTAVIRQAYDSADAIGITVAGKLWEAPQVRIPFAGRGCQILLLSRKQAFQLHRLLVPAG